MTLLGMEPQQKAEMQLFLSMFAMELAEDKETYLQAIDEGIAEILKDETVQRLLKVLISVMLWAKTDQTLIQAIAPLTLLLMKIIHR